MLDCTTTRRLLLHTPIAAEVTQRLVAACKQVRICDPLKEGTVMGPLVNRAAVEDMMAALKQIKAQGGEVLCCGEELKSMPSDCYVLPTIVKARPDMAIVKEETLAQGITFG